MVMDESGTVSLANARFRSLLGVPLENVIGKKPVEWSKDKDLVAFLAGCSGKSGTWFQPRQVRVLARTVTGQDDCRHAAAAVFTKGR